MLTASSLGLWGFSQLERTVLWPAPPYAVSRLLGRLCGWGLVMSPPVGSGCPHLWSLESPALGFGLPLLGVWVCMELELSHVTVNDVPESQACSAFRVTVLSCWWFSWGVVGMKSSPEKSQGNPERAPVFFLELFTNRGHCRRDMEVWAPYSTDFALSC